MHADLEEADIDVKRRPNWLPIDVNYLLPAHTAFEKIPAVFHGFDRKREGCGLMRVSIIKRLLLLTTLLTLYYVAF